MLGLRVTRAAMAAARTIRVPVLGQHAIELDVYGSGKDPHVLLLHGGGQTRHSWASTAEKLAERGCTALAADLRGHGGSFWAPDGNYHPKDIGADIRALIDAPELRDKRLIVVGASLGGMGTMFACADNPRVSAAVLVDITPFMEPEGVDRVLSYMSETIETGFANVDEAIDSIARYSSNRKRSRNYNSVLKNLRLGQDGRYYWHWDPRFLKHDWNSGPDAEAKGRELHEAMLDSTRRIRCPLLLIRGRHSDLVTEDTVRRFLDSVPTCQYVDIEGAAHMVAGDNNDVFAEALLRFIEEVAPPAPASRL